MTIDLEPCPFHHAGKSVLNVRQSGKFTFYVECYGGCRGPKETSERGAIREWNYRARSAQDVAAARERDGLRALLKSVGGQADTAAYNLHQAGVSIETAEVARVFEDIARQALNTGEQS